MDIIDVHAFYGKNKPLGLDYTIDNLVEVQKNNPEHNIKFLIMSASPETNTTIADVVRNNPDIALGAYLQIVPKEELPWRYTPPEEIDELCKREEIKGLKVITSMVQTSISDRILDAYMDVAKKYDIPIMFHCSATGDDYTSVSKIRQRVQRNPGNKIILAHMGGLNPKILNTILRLVDQFDNVSLDAAGTSGEIRRYEVKPGSVPIIKEEYVNKELRLYYQSRLKKVMAGTRLSKKILFGSDYPSLSYDLFPLDILKEEQQKQILENTKELLNT